MSSNLSFLSNWYPFREGEATNLFTIGDWSMPVYTFTILFGILAAIMTISFFWVRAKYKVDDLLILILITIPTSIIGARLWYIFERLIYNGDNPFPGSAWYAVWEGGLSIQGGVIVPTILNLLYIYFNRDRIDYRYALSFILPAVLIGQAIGRWGNYANHEVYGKVDVTGQYTLWLGEAISQNMYIYNASDSITTAALRVPLFFYESLMSIIGYVIIVWIFNLFGLFRPGTTGGIYLLYYGIVRFAMEPLREESYAYYTAIAYVFVAIGIFMIFWFEVFDNKRYVRVREKYWFRYEIVHKRPLRFLGPLAPKEILRKVKKSDEDDDQIEFSEGDVTDNEHALAIPTEQLRKRLKKRRPDR